MLVAEDRRQANSLSYLLLRALDLFHAKRTRRGLMSDLVIVGSGVTARMAHYYFTRDSEHTVAAFTVDHEYLTSNSFQDLPLIDFDEVTKSYPPHRYSMFVALGYAKMNKLRAAKYYQ